jgi:hypothetical protein
MPHACGRHKYNGVLPGAPRGSLMTWARFHPNATQCLTLWLRWTIALFAIFSDVTPLQRHEGWLLEGWYEVELHSYSADILNKSNQSFGIELLNDRNFSSNIAFKQDIMVMTTSF